MRMSGVFAGKKMKGVVQCRANTRGLYHPDRVTDTVLSHYFVFKKVARILFMYGAIYLRFASAAFLRLGRTSRGQCS